MTPLLRPPWRQPYSLARHKVFRHVVRVSVPLWSSGVHDAPC